MATDPEPRAAQPAELSAWIRGAAAGEPADVDRWFRSEHPGVYRLCLGFLADRVEAEDLAQDAMLHLLDHLGDWNPERAYGPWRDAVVLNLCRDRQRRLVARRRAHRAAGASREQRAEEHAVDPHRELERAEVGEVLRETLSALTPREREVFVLRDLEERSTDETARILRVEPSTVRSMLTLARRRLRGLLETRLGSVRLAGDGSGGVGLV